MYYKNSCVAVCLKGLLDEDESGAHRGAGRFGFGWADASCLSVCLRAKLYTTARWRLFLFFFKVWSEFLCCKMLWCFEFRKKQSTSQHPLSVNNQISFASGWKIKCFLSLPLCPFSTFPVNNILPFSFSASSPSVFPSRHAPSVQKCKYGSLKDVGLMCFRKRIVTFFFLKLLRDKELNLLYDVSEDGSLVLHIAQRKKEQTFTGRREQTTVTYPLQYIV